MDKIPMTKGGLERLREELTQLLNVERPKNLKAIEEARGHGDLSENAEYHAAKERQGFLEVKINELKNAINSAQVVDMDPGPADRVVFGRTVVLFNLQTEEEVSYQLVGPYESDPDRGRISVNSPIGQALLGREKGDEVKVRTPKGLQEIEILEIR
jgi:transcription elongation factor GreA